METHKYYKQIKNRLIIQEKKIIIHYLPFRINFIRIQFGLPVVENAGHVGDSFFVLSALLTRQKNLNFEFNFQTQGQFDPSSR